MLWSCRTIAACEYFYNVLVPQVVIILCMHRRNHGLDRGRKGRWGATILKKTRRQGITVQEVCCSRLNYEILNMCTHVGDYCCQNDPCAFCKFKFSPHSSARSHLVHEPVDMAQLRAKQDRLRWLRPQAAPTLTLEVSLNLRLHLAPFLF